MYNHVRKFGDYHAAKDGHHAEKEFIHAEKSEISGTEALEGMFPSRNIKEIHISF